MSYARPVSRRLSAIDFVRGVFMVIIVMGHASANLDKSRSSEVFQLATHHLFRSGTLGFTLTSGVLLGSFLATRADLPRIFARYRTQALRLLFVAHPLLALELYLPLHGQHGREDVGLFEFALRRIYVTDVLATFFLLAPLLPKLRPNLRLFAGAALLAVSREWDCGGYGTSRGWALAREIFAGVESQRPIVLLDGYPWLGLLGMFLIGAWAGDKLGDAQRTDTLARFPRQMTRIAALCLPFAVALVGAWAAVRLVAHAAPGSFARCSLYPDRMGSLFPAYLGAALLLFAFAIHRQTSVRGDVTRAEKLVTLLGKTSLFTYVFQYLPAETVPYLLGLRGHLSVPLLLGWLGATFAVTVGAATLWNRYVKKV